MANENLIKMAEQKFQSAAEKIAKDLTATCYKEPQTNADRIRAMSDEELADWLLHYILEVLDYNGIQHDGLERGEREKILCSLKQPAE